MLKLLLIPRYCQGNSISTNTTSTGPQGVPQTGIPTFAGGDHVVQLMKQLSQLSEMEVRKTIQVKEHTITPDA